MKISINTRNVPLYIDLAFCVIVLPLMVFLMPKESWLLKKYSRFVYMLVVWLYIIYIVNRRLTVPFLFKGHGRMIFSILVFICSLFVTWVITRIDLFSSLYNSEPDYSLQYPQRIIKLRLYRQTVWLFFLVTEVFSFAVGILAEFYRQRQEREKIEYERNKAALALYKAQINPHFLFNTLNTLYGLLITGSDKTEASMERFISLTKYMYSNASRDFIDISEEVEYIGQYIALQKLRLNDFADVDFSCQVESPRMQIPPMLLITFIENAFKYGISSGEPCFIHIRLGQHGGSILFEVENSVFRSGGDKAEGMGIENCRKRLELLYPGRHSLEISQKDNVFYVRLELKN